MWGLGEPCWRVDDGSLTSGCRDATGQHRCVGHHRMGLMLAFDMVARLTKVAYAFMLICVAPGFMPWVAVAAVGICVPPLGLGLATLINRRISLLKNVKPGKATLVMGCVG